MAGEITKCAECGKMFSSVGEARHCGECRSRHFERIALIQDAVEQARLGTAEDIAAYSGLSIMEVHELLEEARQSQDLIAARPRCRCCKSRPALTNGEYCLTCRAKLNAQIESAAEELSDRIGRQPDREWRGVPENHRGVTTLGEKRPRAKGSGSRFTPKGRY